MTADATEPGELPGRKTDRSVRKPDIVRPALRGGYFTRLPMTADRADRAWLEETASTIVAALLDRSRMASRPAEGYLHRLAITADRLPHAALTRLIVTLYTACLDGRGIYVLGEGDGASIAQFFAHDLGRYSLQTAPASLVGMDASRIIEEAGASVAGDDRVLDSRLLGQRLQGLLHRGDVVVAIGTGASAPLLSMVLRASRRLGAITLALTGNAETDLSEADQVLVVPSNQPEHIKRIQLFIAHLVPLALRELDARLPMPPTPSERSRVSGDLA